MSLFSDYNDLLGLFVPLKGFKTNGTIFVSSCHKKHCTKGILKSKSLAILNPNGRFSALGEVRYFYMTGFHHITSVAQRLQDYLGGWLSHFT